MGDVLIHDIPDELWQWLQQEAARCRQTIDELIVDIIETRMFFEGFGGYGESQVHAGGPERLDVEFRSGAERVRVSPETR